MQGVEMSLPSPADQRWEDDDTWRHNNNKDEIEQEEYLHPDILAFYPTIHHCVTGWATQYSDKSACQKYRVCLDRLAF